MFWLLNLLVGLIFSWPYQNTFGHFFSHRLISGRLARQNVYTYIAELRYWMADSLAESSTYLRIGGILLFFMTLSFAGGIIFSILKKTFPGLKMFAQKSYYYLWSMMKIGFLSPLFGFFAAGLTVIMGLPFLIFLPEPFREDSYFYVFLIWTLIGMSWLLIVNLVLDILKVQTVRLNRLKIFDVLRESIKLLSGDLLKVAVLYLFVYIIVLFVLIFYWQISSLSGLASWSGIIFDLLLLQIVIFALIWARLSRYAIVSEYLQKRDFKD